MSDSDQEGLRTASSQGKSVRLAKKERGNRKPIRNISGMIGCLAGIASICLVAVIWWQQQQFVQTQHKQDLGLEKKVAGQQQSIEKQVRMMEQLQRQVASQSADVFRVVQSVGRLQGNRENSWRLAEAEYLLRAANLQIQAERDIAGAMRLLKLANDLLGSINEYALFAVKKGVEEDIATLNGATVVDTSGLWLQLNALFPRIEKLELLSPMGFELEKVKKTAVTEDVERKQPASWTEHVQNLLTDSWHFFSRQFYFRDYGKEKPPELVSPEEEKYLRQNIQLMIMQAQLALLNHDNVTYRHSLANALQWLSDYFHNNSPEAKALQAKLKHLQEMNISPPPPIITHGLLALEAYGKQKHTHTLEKTDASKGSPPSVTPGDSSVHLREKAAESMKEHAEDTMNHGKGSEKKESDLKSQGDTKTVEMTGDEVGA